MEPKMLNYDVRIAEPSLCQVKWEVVSVTLVHHLESKVSAVQDISPRIDYPAVRLHHRLVEVEAIQVESH